MQQLMPALPDAPQVPPHRRQQQPQQQEANDVPSESESVRRALAAVALQTDDMDELMLLVSAITALELE